MASAPILGDVERPLQNMLSPLAGRQLGGVLAAAAVGAGAAAATTFALGMIVQKAAPKADRGTWTQTIANLGEGTGSALIGAAVGGGFKLMNLPYPMVSGAIAGAGTSLALRMAFL